MKIIPLDLHFQGQKEAIACYLIIGNSGPILVETGPGSTLDNLVAGLNAHGYQTEDVRHVLVTHIHLDHAGAAGWWAQRGAQVYVHHVGAPHLINPEKLLSSATRIYKEKMDSLWGPVLPAPIEKVTPLSDGDRVTIGDLTFLAIDTPGHAYHHLVYQLEDVAFSGDAAGIQIPGPKFPDLPAPPPEFNLERWRDTLTRLRRLSISAIYPTHYGRVDEWQQHLEAFGELLEYGAEFVRIRMAKGQTRDEILEAYLAWQDRRAMEAQVPEKVYRRYGLANPWYMSVDGIMRYWHKKVQE